MFGMNKDKLQNLLIFVSSYEDKYVTLKGMWTEWEKIKRFYLYPEKISIW